MTVVGRVRAISVHKIKVCLLTGVRWQDHDFFLPNDHSAEFTFESLCRCIFLPLTQPQYMSQEVSIHSDSLSSYPNRISINSLGNSNNLKVRGVLILKIVALLMVPSIIWLSGCSDNSLSYPSPEGESVPYILKDGCKFTIVEELSKASVSSPTVTGMEGATASASISLGGKSITVSNCEVAENSHSLPIYELDL